MAESTTYYKADKRYNTILDRAFKHHLDLCLVTIYLREKALPNPENRKAFETFAPSEEAYAQYVAVCQLAKGSNIHTSSGVKMTNLDEALANWYKLCAPRQRKEYLDIFSSTFLSQADFRSFYGQDNRNRVCVYCDTSEQDFSLLIYKQRLFSKRLSTRGRTMEVDRKHPHGPYQVANMVLCCYFCNNAKTDEFTFEEFKEIGKTFGYVWKNRLKDIQEEAKA